MKLLVKIVVVLSVLAGFFYLFIRTAHDARSEPYTVARQHLSNWTLSVEPASARTAAVLVLRPPQELAGGLFSQIFSRMMESLRGAVDTGVPLVLREEYEMALASRFTPDALLEAARAAGLESTPFQPECLAVRRVSQPGMTRQMYYVLFDAPAFVRFREALGRDLEGSPVAGAFNPAALSPVLIVAATEASFDSWLPIGSDAAKDCVAPIALD